MVIFPPIGECGTVVHEIATRSDIFNKVALHCWAGDTAVPKFG